MTGKHVREGIVLMDYVSAYPSVLVAPVDPAHVLRAKVALQAILALHPNDEEWIALDTHPGIKLSRIGCKTCGVYGSRQRLVDCGTRKAALDALDELTVPLPSSPWLL